MATLTITTTGAEDARLTVAFGHYLGLPGNASAAQIKADVAAYLINVVRQDEAKVAQAALVPTAPIAPT